MKLLQRIFLPDLWKTTATNRWGVEMEQHHPAMGYRHRTFDDNLSPLPWVAGPHPIAQGLRDTGQQETPGYRSRA